jgi:hypothetical protein
MDYDTLTTQTNKDIEELNAELQRLDQEEERLLVAEAEVDNEIAGLLAKERRKRLADSQSNRRFITSFEIANQRLLEPWSDPADLPKRTTTHDIVSQHLLVEWSNPADLPKSKTTFDAAVAELTQEHPPVEVGALQVLGGTTFQFDGSEWIPTKSEV